MIFGAEDVNLQVADLNGDNDVSILDVILLIGMILDGRDTDATKASLIDNGGVVRLVSNGFIGGVQMVLSHGDNFSIKLTKDALYADYISRDNETTLVIAAPYSEDLFTVLGDYEIREMIVANSTEEIGVTTPSQISLESAYPNPFNPSTTMRLYIPTESIVDVKIYNVMGQEVAILHEGLMSSGYTNLIWNASNVSTGMYIVRAISDGYVSSQKVMLLKYFL